MNFLRYIVLLLTFSGTCLAGGGAGGRSQSGILTLDPASTTTLLGVVDDESVTTVVKKMISVQSNTITVVLDSPGGHVSSGLRLIGVMHNLQAQGKTIRCVVTGMAMSMAFYILSECSERYVMPLSALLFHPIRVAFNGPLTGVEAAALGQSLLSYELYLKTRIIDHMNVGGDWYDAHWVAETIHHGADLRTAAPSFVRVVPGVVGMRVDQISWVPEPRGLFGRAELPTTRKQLIWIGPGFYKE